MTSERSRAPADAPGADRWGSCRGARVLVVDDDRDLRDLLVGRLASVGCLPRGAACGGSALEVLAAAGDEPVDLLLIDLRMPGPSGIDVLRELRASGRLPAAILMTGFAGPAERSEALALGIHVLDKPFTFEALRRAAIVLLLSRRVESRRTRSSRPAPPT